MLLQNYIGSASGIQADKKCMTSTPSALLHSSCATVRPQTSGWNCDGAAGYNRLMTDRDQSFRMGYARVYSSPDGVSHFSDEVLAMNPFANVRGIPLTHTGEWEPATRLRFSHMAAGYLIDWHPASRREFVLILSGMAEETVEDGDARRFGSGSVLFVEDTSGLGHQVHAVGTDDVVYASIVV